MGRKKKVPPAGRSISTRSTRQSAKTNPSIATETSTAADSNSQDSSQDASGENDSQDSNHTAAPSCVPVTSLCHKKFGKYRCLMLGDSKYQLLGNSEVSGSDSETGSGVEVRIVDPCVSSESDCSTPIEFTNCAPTSDSVLVKTFSKLDHDSSSSENQKTFAEKTLHSNILETIHCSGDSNTLDSDTPINLNSISYDTQLPDPTLNLIINSDPRRGYKVVCEDPMIVEEELSPAVSENAPSSGMECFNDGADIAEVVVGDSRDNEEDEVMTVYEIIEENGSDNQDLYFGLTTEDIIYSEPKQTPEVLKSPPTSSDVDLVRNSEQVVQTVEDCVVNDFQNRLENLKLIPCDLIQPESSSMDIAVESKDTPENSSRASSPVLIPQSVISQSSSQEVFPVVTNHYEEETPSGTKLEGDNMNCESNEANLGCSTDSSSCSSASGVRRSNRIKTISVLKQRSKGHGLVRAPQKKTETPLVKEVLVKVSENLCEAISKYSPDSFPSSPSPSVSIPLSSPSFPVPVLDSDLKPVKVKSRWRRSSEMELGSRSPVTPPLHSPNANGSKLSVINESNDNFPLKTDFVGITQSKLPNFQNDDEATQRRLKQFETILENEYHCERTISKEARKMTCDCFLTKEEIERGELGCGEDCLNRLLMIECNSRCPVGDRCTNRRFQSRQYSDLCVMRTEKKGLGIQAESNISGGDFLMEYVGEVLNSKHFNQRAEEYSADKNRHHYFMALKGDAVIDATLKGNISRFINHSCDPNAETQKWTVNGELRIGFFSKRDINLGDEITFDYQFQRYGKEAQRCYCEAGNCRGWIGEEPDTESEEEEEEIEDKDKAIEIKSEIEEGKLEVTDIKEEAKHEVVEDVSAKSLVTEDIAVKKRDRPKKYARAAKELLQDVDLEEEMEMLGRSGVKNQSHTLSLCRAMVRAKRWTARAALLALLAAADLPCRRLFLDYRGLRLLAPWCQDANANFRLDMLTALEKLPIPNKTILQECKLIMYIEKWLSDTCPNKSPKEDSSDNSGQGTPVLIDENTGLPIEVPFKFSHKLETPTLTPAEVVDGTEAGMKPDIVFHTELQKEEIVRLCTLLLERWSQLKEIFKIPKRERIELMKEHERQANEPHTRRDKDPSRRSRWEERYSRDRDRDRDTRDRDRDRDNRDRDNRDRDNRDRDNRDRDNRDRDNRDRDNRDRDNRDRDNRDRDTRDRDTRDRDTRDRDTRDRDKKRSRPPSPDVSHRPLPRPEDRVPSSLSKEERRREFAERAAREEQQRVRLPPPVPPAGAPPTKRRTLLPSPVPNKQWPPPEYMQTLPQGPPPFGPMMMNGLQSIPPPDYMLPPGMAGFVPPEFMPVEYIPDYMQQKPFMLQYCGPPQQMFPMQPNYPNPGFMQMMAQNPNMMGQNPNMMGQNPNMMGQNPNMMGQNPNMMGQNPNMIGQNPNIMGQNPNIMGQNLNILGPNPNFPPPPSPHTPVSTYQNIPLPPSMQQLPLPATPISVKPPTLPHQPVPEIPNQIIIMNPPPPVPPRPRTPIPQSIPTLVPGIPMPTGYPYPTEEPIQKNPPFYPPELPYQIQIQTPTDENQESTDVAPEVPPWTPVRLPSRWRSMQDARGRTYYYHVKLRIPQWEPPLYSPAPHREDNSSDEEDSSNEVDGNENGEETGEEISPVKTKIIEGVDGIFRVLKEDIIGKNGLEILDSPKKLKKKRPGLVTNCWIISPRREEDRLANQLELKRYKENKEKLRRRKEHQALLAAQNEEVILRYKKRLKDKQKKAKVPQPISSSRKRKEIEIVGEDSERRTKEVFRSRMARVMVHHLNPFRREECPLGRITNTADFKHLARKLTHFVMLKELKHCKDVNGLDCNDSVKQKAKEFVKKYMAKFGPVYQRPPDEMD